VALHFFGDKEQRKHYREEYESDNPGQSSREAVVADRENFTSEGS
jgi:hypothetical protein